MSERDELAALMLSALDTWATDTGGQLWHEHEHAEVEIDGIIDLHAIADAILARWRLVPNTEIPGYGPELTALPPGTVLIDKRGDAAVVTEFGLEFPGVPNYMGTDVAWPAIVVWTPENPARDE